MHLELQAISGIHINSISYTISSASFTTSGAIPITWSTSISSTIGGIPAGTGYTITLSAMDASDAGLTCTGTATFDVIAGHTTLTTVHLSCRVAPRTGTVVVNGTLNVCPGIVSVGVSPMEVIVGHSVALSSTATDLDGVPAPLTYAWASASGTLAASDAASTTYTCTSVGVHAVQLTVSDGDCTDVVTTNVVCSMGAATPAHVVIDEVESSGGVPGDWVELVNDGGSSADLSGWVFKDNDDAHGYVLASGTTLAPGAMLVLDEATFGFGLGGADSARIFDSSGALVDAYAWTSHATTTYGRCPSATGAFATTPAPTKGASNGTCGVDAGMGPGTLTFATWPGGDAVTTVDAPLALGTNVSDLFYEAAMSPVPPTLWAVRNDPSVLLRLTWDGSAWSSAAGEWSAGKTLQYPGGLGVPDSEGLTKAESGSAAVYVAAERDNAVSGVSRLSILRFDTSAAGTTLVATHEWNLSADLPAAAPNAGLEAITWVPDAYLVAHGFRDERLAAPYAPAAYANHGSGLFFVGLEATGSVLAYALDHTAGTFLRVATIASGQPAVMALVFDRDAGYLWAHCDDTCGNTTAVLEVDTAAGSPSLGRFAVRGGFARPSSLVNVNHEGVAIAPDSECSGGMKRYFWTDDGATASHALRADTIPCGHFF